MIIESNMELLDAKKLENIKVGPFSGTSYCGHTFPQLKSGICKYYRREENEKFLYCVMDLYIAGTKSKSVMTNLINRLKVLLMEDLSPVELPIVIYSIDQLELFKNDNNPEFLLNVVNAVTQGRRSRIISYLNCDVKSRSDVIEESDENMDKYFKLGDSKELQKLGSLLLKYIQTKDERLLGIYNLLVKMEEPQGVRYRRKDAALLFFEMIKEHIDKSIFTFAMSQYFRREMKERFYYGLWIGCIHLFQDKAVATDFKKEHSLDFTSFCKTLQPIVLDSYVVDDYHVNSAKNSIVKFGKVGAFVLHDDDRLVGAERLEQLKANYQESKVEIEKQTQKSHKKQKI